MNAIRQMTAVALATMAWSGGAVAQTTTTSVTVDWIHDQPTSCGYLMTRTSDTFVDPAGPNWTSLSVVIPLVALNGGGIPTFTVYINGNQVGEPAVITNVNPGFCNGQLPYEFRTGPLPGYLPGEMNTFGVFSEGGSTGGYPAELTFTIEPPAFRFDFPSTAPGAKLLIHKYRDDDPYPSPYQLASSNVNDPPRFSMTGSVTWAGSPASRDVWFRVLDPADTVAYIPPNRRTANDNRDPRPKGVLSVAGCQEASCRATNGAVLKTRSTTNGTVALILEGTSRYGGDNYQLEASTDAQFTCASAGPDGTNICARSGIITAWKRIYVEAHKMFRKGAFIAADVSSGSAEIPVDDVNIFPDPPFQVRLIHAPRIGAEVPDDFYSETVAVRRVEKYSALDGPVKGLLHLRDALDVGDQLTQAYHKEESVKGERRPYLADAVGVVTGAPSDFETVDPSLLEPLLNEAFVDVQWLPDDHNHAWQENAYDRVIPYVAKMMWGARSQTDWLARKWMRNADRIGDTRASAPNHQMVFVAGRTWDPEARAITRVAEGYNDLWLYARSMGNEILRSEGLVHEMGHMWRVNNDWHVTSSQTYTEGHCDTAFGAVRMMASHANLKCTMSSGSNLYDEPQARDGIVGFHYTLIDGVTEDSEFIRIRERQEPVPQTDPPNDRRVQ